MLTQCMLWNVRGETIWWWNEAMLQYHNFFLLSPKRFLWIAPEYGQNVMILRENTVFLRKIVVMFNELSLIID